MSARRPPSRRAPPVLPDRPPDQPIELTVIARRAGLRVSLVRRYLAFGLFDPCGGTNDQPLFDPSSAARVARAERLRLDLGLNHAGAVLVCELLDRIQELEDVAGRNYEGGHE
jgi:hypothetical protein